MFYFHIIIHSDALCSIDCQWDKVFSNANWPRIKTKTNFTFAKHIMIQTWASNVIDSKGSGYEIDLIHHFFHENQNKSIFFTRFTKEKKCTLILRTYKIRKKKTTAQWQDKFCHQHTNGVRKLIAGVDSMPLKDQWFFLVNNISITHFEIQSIFDYSSSDWPSLWSTVFHLKFEDFS